MKHALMKMFVLACLLVVSVLLVGVVAASASYVNQPNPIFYQPGQYPGNAVHSALYIISECGRGAGLFMDETSKPVCVTAMDCYRRCNIYVAKPW